MCAPPVTRHTSIRYSSSCHTHTRQHGYIDILHCCNDPCLYVSEVTWQWWDEYCARNARCTVTTDLLCDIPTHKTTSPPERPFSHYIHSHRLAAEMLTTMKNNLLGKEILSCTFYLYRFGKYVSYGFPIINFCTSGCTLWNALYIMKRPVHYETSFLLWNALYIMKRPVHYETPCILW